MIALISAVFIASLLGSMHCAGMCGAFLAFAVAPSSPSESAPSSSPSLREGAGGWALPRFIRHWISTRTPLHIAYNGGRLATYIILGTLAGSLGAALDLGGSAIGLQRTAAALAGAMMITFGSVAILRAFGVRIQKLPLPKALQSLALKGHRAAAELTPFRRAAAVGLLTTLLPCGWLYAFVITAAGTASPVRGGLTMAVFWLGTLPIMIGLGIGLQTLTGSLRRHLPVATSLLIVAVGLYTILGRLTMPALASAPVRPADTQTTVEQVKLLNSEVPECCRDH